MTTAEAITNRVAQRAAAKQSQDRQEYHQLVGDVASGRDVDEDAAGRLLAHLRVSDQDFRRDVDLLTRRRAAKADVEAAEAIKADRVKAGESLVKLDEAHKAQVAKLVAEHAEKRAALANEYQRLASIERQGGTARAALMGELRPPALAEEMAMLQREIDGSTRAAGFAANVDDRRRHDDHAAALNAKMNELRAACLVVE